ncbi:tRNA-dihydrouridine synthase [Halocatena pleomorpha]|uniref:Dihydropyrimidine dehydrogenase n=1 Tax=Halocatena pleomorpha TaxID=1785090 RepID=A0A3P3RFJ0_9EURY|nr:tRNA-dihydrouridine synthase [Halocatena pleomorpha]RRJ31688.1 dihydropyrimidine dehydrogenase [Halocatena pleomorpha]
MGGSDPVAFTPRVAVASLSGASDAAWARRAAPYAGCAFLGGIALDRPTREAARALTERDREEFLPTDPLAFIDTQLSELSELPITAGFNVRSSSLEPLRNAATVCHEHDAIVEINAHCRQEEMCTAGAGETLLADLDRLCTYVRGASETGATTSVKLRAAVPGVDLLETARQASQAGADILHIDAMDSEPVIEAVAAHTDAFLIANNGVRDRETVREYFDYGADAVSVGRPSDDPRVLARVHDATVEWFGLDRRVDA